MTVTSSRACAWALELVILKIGTGGITWIRQASRYTTVLCGGKILRRRQRILVSLVYAAEKKEPGKPRTLYLDIDGHRNAQGRFDADMRSSKRDSD